MINAGKYNRKITIVSIDGEVDKAGFKKPPVETVILNTWASVKTTKGYTLIKNNSDFEKAYTNFTIRFPKVEITREMFVKYNNKTYSIEYLNDIDEKGNMNQSSDYKSTDEFFSDNKTTKTFSEGTDKYNQTAVQNAVMSMLLSFGRLISDDYHRSLRQQNMRTEHKLKSAIRRKKQALGLKESHTEQKF